MSGITPFLKSIGGALGDATDFLTSASAPQTFGSAQELVDCAFEEIAYFTKPAADGMASTATAATKGNDVNAIGGCYFNAHSYDMEVFGLIITPNAALTSDPANFATIQILTDDAAGGAAAVAISLATTTAAPGSGNWVTNIHQKATQVTANAATKGVITAANLRLRPGANLFVAITKAGTGVVVPICSIAVLMRKR